VSFLDGIIYYQNKILILVKQAQTIAMLAYTIISVHKTIDQVLFLLLFSFLSLYCKNSVFLFLSLEQYELWIVFLSLRILSPNLATFAWKWRTWRGLNSQVKLTLIVLAFSILKICHKDYLQEKILALSNNSPL